MDAPAFDPDACILCVDDEETILKILRTRLGRLAHVETAHSGQAGLDWLAAHAAPALVVSDLNMGAMDGIEFLARVRSLSPDSTRLLLTGQPDLDSALGAVNKGQVFRFLTKPFRDEDLMAAAEASLELHRLKTAEKTLLEKTLMGCAQALVDLLSLADPAAYGRAQRIRHRAEALAADVGLAPGWQLHIALLLAQVGCVTLPPDLSEKLQAGKPLESPEQALVDRLPSVAVKLLAPIPRLEGVRAILEASLAGLDGPFSEEPAEVAGRILRAATDLEPLLSDGKIKASRIPAFLDSWTRRDPKLAAAMRKLTGESRASKSVGLHELEIGYELTEDVLTTSGLMLVARGFHVTQELLEKIDNFKPGSILEPLHIKAL